MNTLDCNFQNLLPINRKERFYTGTVLPQIICYDNFNYLSLFFNLIEGFPKDIKVYPDADSNSILFLTEYSLKESANFSGRKYDNIPTTKDTPDLIILITDPEPLLIVAEGKMFSQSDIQKFKEQIAGQKKIIACITENLNIKPENVFHIGLVPRSYFNINLGSSVNFIYWESIVEAYQGVIKNNYFLETLKIALKNYDALSSRNELAFGSFGKNMQDKLNGEEIMKFYLEGKKVWVGRKGGLYGNDLKNDLNSGGWKKFQYEVNYTSDNAPNNNWFSAKDFAKLICENQNSEPSLINWESDPWHFSHLGKDYFVNISRILGFGGVLDCPINILYTGKSSEVSYMDKHMGRKVDPNWSVILNDGRNYKFGKPTGNKLVEGLWNKSNCIATRWRDIKNYQWRNDLKNQEKIS